MIIQTIRNIEYIYIYILLMNIQPDMTESLK